MNGYILLHPGRGIVFLILLFVSLFSYHIFLKRRVKLPLFPLFFFEKMNLSKGILRLFEFFKIFFLLIFFSSLFLGISQFSKREIFFKPATKGIDIAIALDISTSMSARDFDPDRLTVSKLMIEKFIKMRKNDRIALLLFAANSFVLSPLTMDHTSLIALLKSVKLIPFDMDGTAIGMAIVNGINLLRHSKAKSKVMLLMTDGSNNKGEISPLTAAQFAREYEIKIYTIGIGSGKEAEVLGLNVFDEPVYVKRKVQFDEETLKEIAKKTGGEYFRARDGNALFEIASKIDKMEKTPFERKKIVKIKELDNFLFLFSILSLMGYILILSLVEKKF